MSGKGPIVLCVVDGLGVRDGGKDNAFALAETPTLDAIFSGSGGRLLAASGEAVGLPEDEPGNGEIGHLTMGAGPLVETARHKFDRAVEKRKLGFTKMLDQTVRICMYDETPIHLLGTVSGSKAHADMNHLYQLIDTFAFNDIPIVIHAILDGRDCPPQSAMKYLERVLGYIEDRDAKVGTVMGRFFGMDTNERWDRTYAGYHAIVRDKQFGPEALHAETCYDAVNAAYVKDLSDDLIEPTRIGDFRGMNGDYLCDFSSHADKQVWEWTGLDVGLVFNHRMDGIRQLVAMLARQDLPEYVTEDLLMDRQFPQIGFREHCFASLASPGGGIDIPVLFPTDPLADTLGEVVAKAGLQQLRCGESEKRAHVTRFLSGGHEEPFDGETHKIVKSPRLVETYDDKPEMSAAKVAKAVVAAIDAGDTDLIVASFANADMLSKLDTAKRGLAAIDDAVAAIRDAVKAKSGTLIVTSDHGNCEQLLHRGERHMAHTDNPVPFGLATASDEKVALREDGNLCDIAPTVLDLLDIEKPDAMTGTSLRKQDD